MLRDHEANLVLERILEFQAHLLALGLHAVAQIDEQNERANQDYASGPEEGQPASAAGSRSPASSPSHFRPPASRPVASMAD